MPKDDKQTFDVFVSHSQSDRQLAKQVAAVLESFDLDVFVDVDEVALGEKLEDVVWDAMADSQAIVMVVPNNPPSSWMAFEMGAAKAWNKPVYAIADGVEDARRLSGLHDIAVYPPSRADEIAIEIKRSLGSLTDEEVESLKDAYQKIGVSVDRLATQPNDLAKLTREVTKRIGRNVSGEHVLWLLMRLRKRGQLQALRKQTA